MKKLSVILSASAILFGMGASALAWSGNVPSAAKAPVLDGKIDAAEWAGALVSNVGMASQDKNGSWSSAGPLSDVEWKSKPASAVMSFMWDAKNLYVAGVYTDTNVLFKVEPSGDGLKASSPTNCQDAMQVILDPLGGAEAMNDLNIIDFTMTPDATSAMYWQHWGDPRREFSGVKMFAVKTATGYQFEAAVPWSDFETSYKPKVGDALGYATVVLDMDEEGMVGLIADDPAMPWAEPQNINKLTLK